MILGAADKVGVAFSPLIPLADVYVVEQEQEKLLAQRKVPGLQSQLEEYKSALCQLQAQKLRLHTEVGHVSVACARCK